MIRRLLNIILGGPDVLVTTNRSVSLGTFPLGLLALHYICLLTYPIQPIPNKKSCRVGSRGAKDFARNPSNVRLSYFYTDFILFLNR